MKSTIIDGSMKTCPGCGLLYPDESTFCFLDGQTLRAYDDALLGRTIDGLYRVDELIGRSGWSRVYRGRLRLVNQPCVIKVVELPAAGARTAFQQALGLGRRCSHGNVAPVIGGRLWSAEQATAGVVVRPASEAQPLALLIERARLDASQATGLALQILAALGRIHDFGGVHGGVKPQNALYWSNGHVDLIDVGVGRSLLREPWEDKKDVLGAQHYLAPELNSQQPSSAEADLYAAGVIAFELLAAKKPFSGSDLRELRHELVGDGAPDPSGLLARVPEPISRWTLRMIARDPGQRPENAHHARDLLLAACRQAQVAPMIDPGRPEDKPAREVDPLLGRWMRYQQVFARMLEVGFPSGAPEQTKSGYGAIAGRIERLSEIGKRALFDQGNLDGTHERAREGRERIAAQIDELTAGSAAIRERLDPLRAKAAERADAAKQFPARALAQHRELVQWEGRCAFAEPYPELAAAYRQQAAVIEQWCDLRRQQLDCERETDSEREKLRDLEAQVEELRAALKVHESNIAGEIDVCESGLSELGKEADRIELELLDLASRFSAPLRSKPELGPVFRELGQA